jgi:hypothetical protein
LVVDVDERVGELVDANGDLGVGGEVFVDDDPVRFEVAVAVAAGMAGLEGVANVSGERVEPGRSDACGCRR